jgi:hypothetical protein
LEVPLDQEEQVDKETGPEYTRMFQERQKEGMNTHSMFPYAKE